MEFQISLLNELRGGPNIIELYDVYETETYVFLVKFISYP